MSKGYLSLVLHAHLPFVRHPEEDVFLEENWLYEAITETYIPLIQMFERLSQDQIHFRLTMSLTPPLINMLQDPLLQDRYIRHIDKLIELSEKEIVRTKNSGEHQEIAKMYNRRFKEARGIFADRYHKNLINAFKKFQDEGCLEIMTCAATHGFLPLLNVNPSSVKAQINIAVDHYQKIFGRPPNGIWLPECGYYPGVDEFLKDAGIRYFFVDSHGIINSDPKPKYSVYAPLFCPTGVAAFGRDWESSKQVWSSKEGYPGDPDYREYYRDIGYDCDYEYIKPYIHPEGFRINTGMKYWRITGQTDQKEPYNEHWAREKASQHAGNFLFNRQKQIEHLKGNMDRKPIVIAPYDAELFGHWWYEGPIWLEFLIRKTVCDQDTIELATPSDYLAEYSSNQLAMPSVSSWGHKGYNEYWLDGSNDWIYRHLHKAGERMVELANTYFSNKDSENNTLLARALNQAARELLLAESSDWPFIMKTGTMVPYAEKRIKQHISRFTRIYEDIKNSSINENWLKELEWRDSIFTHMNCASYYLSTRQKDKPRRESALICM